MPSKSTARSLTCKCGNSKLIKCLDNRDYSNWRCRSCAIAAKWMEPSYRASRPTRNSKQPKIPRTGQQISQSLREYYASPINRTKMSLKLKAVSSDPQRQECNKIALANCKEKRVASSMAMWTPEFRQRMAIIKSDPAYLDRQSQASIALWKDPEYRLRVLDAKSTPEFKEKMRLIQIHPDYLNKLAVARASQDKVSSLQIILYSILDDLGVPYYKERSDGPDDPQCIIGPYNVDCVIPRDGKPSLVIEVQGDYWHSQARKIRIDQAKATYLAKYFGDQYELKYLWEHEFYCRDKISSTIRYWLGLDFVSDVKYDLASVNIKTANTDDAKLLLSKYHYIPSVGRNGMIFGAYLADVLIAVCMFSPFIRQNADSSIRELSRYCVHPNFRNPNLGSWFIARAIRMLSPTVKSVISFCDTTFNHNGALYKACNFQLDSEVPPDYWYRTPDGWVMHKKTLYNRAVKNRQTEREFAEQYGYAKIFGDKKLKFVFNR